MQTFNKNYVSPTKGMFKTELVMVTKDQYVLYIWHEFYSVGQKTLKAIRQGTRQACEVYRAVFMNQHDALSV